MHVEPIRFVHCLAKRHRSFKVLNAHEDMDLKNSRVVFSLSYTYLLIYLFTFPVNARSAVPRTLHAQFLRTSWLPHSKGVYSLLVLELFTESERHLPHGITECLLPATRRG